MGYVQNQHKFEFLQTFPANIEWPGSYELTYYYDEHPPPPPPPPQVPEPGTLLLLGMGVAGQSKGWVKNSRQTRLTEPV